MPLSSFASLQARIASRLVVITCGVPIFGIGAATVAGYVGGLVRLYQWDPGAVGMAPNTGIAFVLTGLALSVIGSSNRIWRCS